MNFVFKTGGYNNRGFGGLGGYGGGWNGMTYHTMKIIIIIVRISMQLKFSCNS